MDDKTLNSKLDLIFKNFETLGNNQKVIVGKIDQVEERIKQQEIKVATLMGSAEMLMNLYNRNKDKLDEALGSVLETLKDAKKKKTPATVETIIDDPPKG